MWLWYVVCFWVRLSVYKDILRGLRDLRWWDIREK